MKKQYCLIADVMGFSNIVRNLDEIRLEEKIHSLAALIKTVANETNITHENYQLMSDTIFVKAENSSDGLKKLLDFSKLLLNKGIEDSFPIRGAISFGHLLWNDNAPTIYGDAILKAHTLERSQEWIGITCEPGLPHLDQLKSLWIEYPTPMKGGLIKLYPAVKWNVPSYQQLSQHLNKGGLTKPGEELKWEHIGHKLTNTTLFGYHLKILDSVEPNDEFQGLPIELIEKIIHKYSCQDSCN
jgi:hypothetical protein